MSASLPKSMARSSIALFLAGAGLATSLTGCSPDTPQRGEGDQTKPAAQSPAPPAQQAPGDREGGEGGEGGEG